MTDARTALSELLQTVAQQLSITRPLAVLDLESTGVNTKRDRIVEITIARCDPDPFRTQAMHSLVNPGIPIPKDAAAIHGITDADVRESPTFERIVPYVVRLLGGADVIAYNGRRFDLRMVAAECRRVGLANPCDGARLVDPQVIFFKREPRDLAAALRYFCGDANDGAHGTTADVIATLRVLLAQLDRYPDVPRDVAALDELAREASWIDRDGKFIWRGDEPCCNVGDWQGVSLREVDPGFLRWMLDKDFADDAKAIARQALRGNYPTPPAPASEETAVA